MHHPTVDGQRHKQLCAELRDPEHKARRIVLATSSKCTLNPRLLHYMAPYDVARSIRQARHLLAISLTRNCTLNPRFLS